MKLGTCEFCNRDVTQGEKAAFRVRGWEVQRVQGGANKIVGKERQPNRIAHASCVEFFAKRQRLGLQGQEDLF